MKKQEAQLMSKEESNLIMEYIEQFLSCDDSEFKIDISYYKERKQEAICSFEIYAPNGWERHYHTEVTLDHADLLNEQILNDIADKYLESDVVGISPFTDIHVFMPTENKRNFHGITITSENSHSKISLNFEARGNRFSEIVEEYNDRLATYQNSANGKSR